MTRGGRDKDRDEPERRCIVTGERAPKGGLVRFVIGPDGAVVPDILARLPGRGIYVAADRAALDKAARKGLFARAARAPVKAPDDLSGTVEALLLRRVTELIALARKAGQAVSGREKTLDWLVKGQAAILLQASDGSPREAARLRPPDGEETRIACLTAGELGLSFGRDRA
ncbi:MAG: RNA-binding protein, partial [Gemmobacter sp.]